MNSIALLILRVSFSASMLFGHGVDKLTKLIDGTSWTFKYDFIPYPKFDISWANPLYIGEVPTLMLAVFSEFIAPLFIIIGYKTKFFSFFTAATMFVAAFIVHWGDPFVRIEKALLFFVVFSILMITGPGKYSFDRKFS